MGQKQAGLDLMGDAFQVAVVPGGQNVAKKSGGVAFPVPTDAKTVPVNCGHGFAGVKALFNQRMFCIEQEFFQKKGFAVICQPSAHGLPVSMLMRWAIEYPCCFILANVLKVLLFGLSPLLPRQTHRVYDGAGQQLGAMRS